MIKFIEAQATGTIGAEQASDGTYPVVLITPGQGTSGYYHEQVIRDYAAEAFPKGTHVYLDHLNEGQQRTPERLLGTLIDDTTVNDQGEAVNRFKPLKKHREWVEEVRPFVGLSVCVSGDGRPGEVDGRQTKIVERLYPSIDNTVDVVSFAGRGGRFLESYLAEANTQTEGAERTQAETAAGTTEGKQETMALSEEDKEAFRAIVREVVAELKPAEPVVEKPEDKEVVDVDAKVAEERVLVADALVAVESAPISDATKARLRESVKAGNYDVQAQIDAEKTLIESLRADLAAGKLTESGASAAGAASAATADYEVKGW